MSANAKPIRPSPADLPTLDDVASGKITLDEYEVAHGEDIPEWTEEDFRRARPISDFPELREALDRARGQRGPQKTPVKERIGLRLDRHIVEHFRATGPGWQSRINAILDDHIRSRR